MALEASNHATRQYAEGTGLPDEQFRAWRGIHATCRWAHVRGSVGLNLADKAYVAGLFDGEGCITTALSSPGRIRPRIRIAIAGAFRDTLVWVQAMFGGIVKPNRKASTNKMVYVLAIGTFEEQLFFLETVRPFLREKATQADATIDFLRVRVTMGRRGVHAVSSDLDRMAQELRSKLSADKKRLASFTAAL